MVRSLPTVGQTIVRGHRRANLLGGGLTPAFFKSSLALCVNDLPSPTLPLPIRIWPSESCGKGPSLAIAVPPAR